MPRKKDTALSVLLDRVGARFPGHIMRRLMLPDGRFRYTYASPHLRDTFGLDVEAIVADDPATHSWIHPDDRAGFEEALRVSARDMTTFDEEVRVFTGDGRTRWVRSLSTPTRLLDGTVAWDGIALDVTERREAAEAMERALRLARDAEARGAVPGVAPPEVVAALDILDEERLSERGVAALAALRRVLAPGAAPAGGPALSPRQREVQSLLARGLSNREIAERLGITPGTAKLHVSAVLKRLGAANRTQAALR
ncbi:LuxR C-terminal-related transcriptional regulator [Roseomonas sp. CCTCC AB2023176]|uniref:LuxR C-terminal-related transcriptional regulator n=1 Tax=Roseomonas sp. CCTCC AB2023176 TaxID=3342640 RepID=UPI0035DC5C0D